MTLNSYYSLCSCPKYFPDLKLCRNLSSFAWKTLIVTSARSYAISPSKSISLISDQWGLQVKVINRVGLPNSVIKHIALWAKANRCHRLPWKLFDKSSFLHFFIVFFVVSVCVSFKVLILWCILPSKYTARTCWIAICSQYFCWSCLPDMFDLVEISADLLNGINHRGLAGDGIDNNRPSMALSGSKNRCKI